MVALKSLRSLPTAGSLIGKLGLSALHRRPWHWRKVEEASLARYVNPECVAEAVPAVESDGEQTVRDLLDDGQRLAVAELLYNTISAREIDYDIEGYVPDTEAVQRVRTPIEIWNRGRATCLDLALLYAGACLNEGLRPLLIVLNGHALAAVVDADFELPLPEPSGEAANLNSWVEQGTIVPIECTGMSNGEDLDYDFATARRKGIEAIQSRAIDFYFDPKQLHQGGRVEPESCHRTSVPRLVATTSLILALIGGGLWWLAQPGPPIMEATGGANLAVYPFNVSGAGDETVGVGLAQEVALQLRQEFDGRGELQTSNRPGWEVWGPSKLSAKADDGFDLADDLGSELGKRNIDVAVYGLVEDIKGRTFADVNIWFQPSQRASLGGLSGPIEVRRDLDGSNGSTARVAATLAEESDGWFRLLGGLGLIQDAESIDDLLEARARFKSGADSVSLGGQSLAAFSEVLIGSTHLLIDATITVDADEARRHNLQLATDAFTTAITLAPDDDDVVVRSHLGLAQTSILTSGCQPDAYDGTALDAAAEHVALARSRLGFGQAPDLGADHAVEPAERWFKTTLADAWIKWCRWSAGQSDGNQSLALLNAVVDNFEARTERYQRERAEHLAAQAYALRALLTGLDQQLSDPEGSVADAALAQCLAPELSTSFVRDEIRGDLHDRYPELPKESCRDQ